ncbi:hypothetical protein WM24_23850 [Burkholderia ubonensis]|uniref:hypothetical protein n=1 Tax=Burkholderia ubonensis TaxID=101571 RepID=UPI00075D0BC5|nr:hypothetical protein [Burkholderia ubonensis]KWN80871.1 hypothetical protein WM24_23850 [Burkholderia ubonensis]
MKLDRKLNLVLNIESGHVHHAPISKEVFERYFLPISKTFTRIYAEGLGSMAGPRVAAMMLKKVAQDDNIWEGVDGVENGLMNEIRRLTNVVLPSEQGWSTLPYYEALRQDMLDEDEVSEVENALCFFTCAVSMHKKNERNVIVGAMTLFWGGQITSSGLMEFARSLPTSTADENTGEKATA